LIFTRYYISPGNQVAATRPVAREGETALQASDSGSKMRWPFTSPALNARHLGVERQVQPLHNLAFMGKDKIVPVNVGGSQSQAEAEKTLISFRVPLSFQGPQTISVVERALS
jgi:hypothetical protein